MGEAKGMRLFNYSSVIGTLGLVFGLLATLSVVFGKSYDTIYLVFISLYHIPIGFLIEKLEKQRGEARA